MKIATIILLSICVAAFAQQKGSFTDPRDGKTYKTVKIGTQTWMAENLNYEAKGSKCYNNKPANCDKYGRLYDWNTAVKACPVGWHLPSAAEWEVLTNSVGDETAGTILKAKSGWSNNGNGTDTYGFSALPGGNGGSAGSFFDRVGVHGLWWTATEHDASNAHLRSMLCLTGDVGKDEIGDGLDKNLLVSVRCLHD